MGEFRQSTGRRRAQDKRPSIETKPLTFCRLSPSFATTLVGTGACPIDGVPTRPRLLHLSVIMSKV